MPSKPVLFRVACLLAALAGASRSSPAAGPFAYRGYYFILSRNPTYGLEDYRRILDCMAEDRCNLLILWIGGGFPSKRYPETWDYNRAHRNCSGATANFAGAAIDYAHSKGIRVVLGLTPFAYDGVNRYGEAHPELGAVDRDGRPAVTGGIHSLGRGLCPAQAAAQDFMDGYCAELIEELYPQADGFFLEHSDYGVCQCEPCRAADGAASGYLRREWDFVARLSRRVWARKPNALMLVYPQYAALGVEYDRRHVVFLAPHNMKSAERIANPKVLWHGYWDDGASWEGLCREAARAGFAGVVPSMENFVYEHPWAFDTRWGPQGSIGWRDPLVRLTRLSFRVYAARPDLDAAGWREAVQREFFPDLPADSPEIGAAVADLLALHRHLNRWESWTRRGGVMRAPAEKIELAGLEAKARERLEKEILPALEEIEALERRFATLPTASKEGKAQASAVQLASISRWVLAQWEGKRPDG